jgi:hypothetical protein
MGDDHEKLSAADCIDEIEQYAAIHAVATSPATTADEPRRIDDEFEAMGAGHLAN